MILDQARAPADAHLQARSIDKGGMGGMVELNARERPGQTTGTPLSEVGRRPRQLLLGNRRDLGDLRFQPRPNGA
jgi:hypothetical protein